MVAVIIVFFLAILANAVKVLREYERGVVFRLGRLLGDPKGPGLFLLIPIVDRMVKVDLRVVTLVIPPQEVITRDNVPVRVNAVAYFQTVDPSASIVKVADFGLATSQISQTTLRSVLGQHMLDELLSERDKINQILQRIIDEQTGPWGIKVNIVEVRDVEIPSGMQRAMARQAEAERERRAKVIAAEGEFQASAKLTEAAAVISEHPIALTLRYLQTLTEIAGTNDEHHHLPGADRPAAAVPAEDDDRGAEGIALDLRTHPLTGETVLVVPGRASRPGATGRTTRVGDAEHCPFCEGHESMTPPETAAFGRPAGAPADSPGWIVRVVPNKYPAFPGHEVVVHGPRHVTSLGDLPPAVMETVMEAWRSRRAALLAGGAGYVLASVNEGAAAGASLDHSHSQLVPFPDPPPRIVQETGGVPGRLPAVPAAGRDRARAGGPGRLLPPVRARAVRDLDRAHRPPLTRAAGRRHGPRTGRDGDTAACGAGRGSGLERPAARGSTGE